jgi:hypothetical protein
MIEDRVASVSVIPWEARADLWGVALTYQSGREIIQPVGSHYQATLVAERLEHDRQQNEHDRQQSTDDPSVPPDQAAA